LLGSILPSDLKVGMCEYLMYPIEETEDAFSTKTKPRAPEDGFESAII
jgi:hypothetical protein